ncbi:MAG TPA: BON domain-containing protein [Casimicrobiaceae bacterium]|nr:BON domain-containing protein [Casimicrobiaceae bacterium]
MNSLQRKTLLISLVIGTAVAGAACNQRSPSTTGQNMSPDSSPPKTAMAPTTTPTAPTGQAPTTSGKMANAVDDATITAQVKSAIMAEPGLKSTNINVDTKDAIVTLTGTVPSSPLKDKAKEIASNVAGVKSVQDNLTTTQSG